MEKFKFGIEIHFKDGARRPQTVWQWRDKASRDRAIRNRRYGIQEIDNVTIARVKPVERS